MRVSIMEDDQFIADQIAIYFQSKGAEVDHYIDGEALLESEKLPEYDIFLLDIDTPRVNGLEALNYLREIGIRTPAIFVTAKSHLDDVKEGYACGCNDYVRKPFDIEELELRIQALIPKTSRTVSLTSEIIYDLDQHCFIKDRESVFLGQTEQKILELLVRNQNKIVPVDDFRDWVWQGKEVSEATIRSFMRLLREKVGDSCIQTHRGIGYSLTPYVST